MSTHTSVLTDHCKARQTGQWSEPLCRWVDTYLYWQISVRHVRQCSRRGLLCRWVHIFLCWQISVRHARQCSGRNLLCRWVPTHLYCVRNVRQCSAVGFFLFFFLDENTHISVDRTVYGMPDSAVGGVCYVAAYTHFCIDRSVYGTPDSAVGGACYVDEYIHISVDRSV